MIAFKSTIPGMNATHAFFPHAKAKAVSISQSCASLNANEKKVA